MDRPPAVAGGLIALRALSALAVQAPAEPRTLLRVRRNSTNKAKGHPEVAFCFIGGAGGI